MNTALALAVVAVVEALAALVGGGQTRRRSTYVRASTTTHASASVATIPVSPAACGYENTISSPVATLDYDNYYYYTTSSTTLRTLQLFYGPGVTVPMGANGLQSIPMMMC